MTAAATSFSVVSGTDRDGNALSGLYGFIIDEGTADEEFVVGTISGTTVTISKRGCDADDPETEVLANKKAHRRGASVKITDYPILAYIRNMLAVVSGYELPTLLRYASNVGNPTNDYDIAHRAWVLTVVNGGAVSHDKLIVAGTAGETVAAGNLVYFDDTDNEWKKCDADTAATVENVILGIAQGAGVDGGAISGGVLLFGLDENQSGLTAGAPYYASNTAGEISSSAGTKEVTVGFAKSTTSLYFYPRFDQQLTEDQQDALAGTSGTPSGLNKYVTANDVSASAAADKIVRSGSDNFIASGFIGTSKKVSLSTTELTFTDGNGGAGAGSEQTLFSATIPGGLLGTNNGIKFKIFIRDANILQNAASWVFKVKYGGVTQLTLNSVASLNNLAGLSGFLEGYILADGATNAQKMTAEALLLDTAASTAESATDAAVSMDKSHFFANAAGAIDSTANQTLEITLTQTNNAANDCVVEWCVIESIR
ncbi:MAG: hypothetical protein AB1757_06785 [Acidobacteriota bacterium]